MGRESLVVPGQQVDAFVVEREELGFQRLDRHGQELLGPYRRHPRDLLELFWRGSKDGRNIAEAGEQLSGGGAPNA
jgi:hypothetical protein